MILKYNLKVSITSRENIRIFTMVNFDGHFLRNALIIIHVPNFWDSVYSGTSLLWTLWDLDFSPYYRGILNSEVI